MRCSVLSDKCCALLLMCVCWCTTHIATSEDGVVWTSTLGEDTVDSCVRLVRVCVDGQLIQPLPDRAFSCPPPKNSSSALCRVHSITTCCPLYDCAIKLSTLVVRAPFVYRSSPTADISAVLRQLANSSAEVADQLVNSSAGEADLLVVGRSPTLFPPPPTLCSVPVEGPWLSLRDVEDVLKTLSAEDQQLHSEAVLAGELQAVLFAAMLPSYEHAFSRLGKGGVGSSTVGGVPHVETLARVPLPAVSRRDQVHLAILAGFHNVTAARLGVQPLLQHLLRQPVSQLVHLSSGQLEQHVAAAVRDGVLPPLVTAAVAEDLLKFFGSVRKHMPHLSLQRVMRRMLGDELGPDGLTVLKSLPQVLKPKKSVSRSVVASTNSEAAAPVYQAAGGGPVEQRQSFNYPSQRRLQHPAYSNAGQRPAELSPSGLREPSRRDAPVRFTGHRVEVPVTFRGSTFSDYDGPWQDADVNRKLSVDHGTYPQVGECARDGLVWAETTDGTLLPDRCQRTLSVCHLGHVVSLSPYTDICDPPSSDTDAICIVRSLLTCCPLYICTVGSRDELAEDEAAGGPEESAVNAAGGDGEASSSVLFWSDVVTLPSVHQLRSQTSDERVADQLDQVLSVFGVVYPVTSVPGTASLQQYMDAVYSHLVQNRLGAPALLPVSMLSSMLMAADEGALARLTAAEGGVMRSAVQLSDALFNAVDAPGSSDDSDNQHSGVWSRLSHLLHTWILLDFPPINSSFNKEPLEEPSDRSENPSTVSALPSPSSDVVDDISGDESSSSQYVTPSLLEHTSSESDPPESFYDHEDSNTWSDSDLSDLVDSLLPHSSWLNHPAPSRAEDDGWTYNPADVISSPSHLAQSPMISRPRICSCAILVPSASAMPVDYRRARQQPTLLSLHTSVASSTCTCSVVDTSSSGYQPLDGAELPQTVSSVSSVPGGRQYGFVGDGRGSFQPRDFVSWIRQVAEELPEPSTVGEVFTSRTSDRSRLRKRPDRGSRRSRYERKRISRNILNNTAPKATAKTQEPTANVSISSTRNSGNLLLENEHPLQKEAHSSSGVSCSDVKTSVSYPESSAGDSRTQSTYLSVVTSVLKSNTMVYVRVTKDGTFTSPVTVFPSSVYSNIVSTAIRSSIGTLARTSTEDVSERMLQPREYRIENFAGFQATKPIELRRKVITNVLKSVNVDPGRHGKLISMMNARYSDEESDGLSETRQLDENDDGNQNEYRPGNVFHAYYKHSTPSFVTTKSRLPSEVDDLKETSAEDHSDLVPTSQADELKTNLVSEGVLHILPHRLHPAPSSSALWRVLFGVQGRAPKHRDILAEDYPLPGHQVNPPRLMPYLN